MSMQNSPLRNKSEMLMDAAVLLHKNTYYLAVAHAAYYSCYQMMKYIWLYSMCKTEEQLELNTSQSRFGSHEYLLNEVVKHIIEKKNENSNEDARFLRNNIPILKKLRTDADYKDTTFDCEKSENSMKLSKDLLSILKKY